MQNIGKSQSKVEFEPNTGVSFADVAGIDEAKEELEEIVNFLKYPAQYAKLGAKIPRGALLVGPPGTGKTLLAKAVAGEAGVPFVSVSAAEFIEIYVGVGASRVRDLFKKAKENAPCIVFIDEIDAVGRQRGVGVGQGNDEREQTINQILTEMDGFEGNSGIIVLAATNIPDVLDKALLRPGRFDRQVQVTLADQKGREAILRVHARDKRLAEEVDITDIAKKTIGMNGAELANVLNEAAISTARNMKAEIENDDVDYAIERMQLGLEKQGRDFSEYRQNLVAYHEAGHALLGVLMEDYDELNKISIVPRGNSGGVTLFTPNEETQGLFPKDYLLNRICVGMGGRIAEEMTNGKNKITTGAQNDFEVATNTARMMVEQMGMSERIGPRNISTENLSMAQMFSGEGKIGGGQTLQDVSDEEIDRILNEQYERGMKLLESNSDVLDHIAKLLIEKEKISGKLLIEEIMKIKPGLLKNSTIPDLENATDKISELKQKAEELEKAADKLMEASQEAEVESAADLVEK